jgi:hypothetical protein
VPIDGTGTTSVEAVKALPVPGMQKPPSWVGKQFRDHCVAAPQKRKVKIPAGLKTRPAWLRQDRLARAWRSAAATRAARHGVRCRADLKVADGDHLVLLPDSDGEGAGAAAQNRVGAVEEELKGWN